MFDTRIAIVREYLAKEKLDAVLISSVANITYLSGQSNFSIIEREAYVFIGKNFAYIITDARYSEAIEKEVTHLKLYERGNGKSLEGLLKKHKNKIKVLGIEEDNLTVSEQKAMKKHFKKIRDFNFPRSIKEKIEIEKIEAACKIADKAFRFVLSKIRAGMTEKELAIKIETFIRENGSELSFPTIAAFGKNSSIPHHHTGDTKLVNNNFVLMDFGVRWKNYCSDMSRTIFFGSPSGKQRKIHEVVLSAQKKAVDFANKQIKSGKKLKAFEMDEIARDYILSKGFSSIPHSLGHGIGIEVHERPYISPGSKEELKRGMVFSIEPGIYIPGFGGVRIEDLYVIEKNGLRQLTTSNKILTRV